MRTHVLFLYTYCTNFMKIKYENKKDCDKAAVLSLA